MLRVLFLVGALCVGAASTQINRTDPIVLHGTVYGVDGSPMTHPVRVQWQDNTGTRPPEYFFTDSSGNFTLLVIPGLTYTFVVQSDGETYETAVVRYLVPVINPRVDINLRPLSRRTVATADSKVSVAELSRMIPDEARKRFRAGVEALRADKLDRARSEFERALAAYEPYADAHNELAVVLMRQNKLPEAEKHLIRALEIDPEAGKAALNLGLCLYRQKRYAEAIPHLEKGLQLEPGHADAQLLLGTALKFSGQEDKAEPVLLRAYEIAGQEVADAQLHLAEIYYNRKDYVRSAKALEVYLRDRPNAPNAAQLRETLAQLKQAAKEHREGGQPPLL